MKNIHLLFALIAVLSLGQAAFANGFIRRNVATSANSTFRVGDDTTDFTPDFPPEGAMGDEAGGAMGGDSHH